MLMMEMIQLKRDSVIHIIDPEMMHFEGDRDWKNQY